MSRRESREGRSQEIDKLTPRIRRYRRSRIGLQTLQTFLKLQSASGIILVAMMGLALLMVNSPLQPAYGAFIHLPVSVRLGELALEKSLLHWINDGLMAIFFMLVSLEIKREVMIGALSSRQRAMLPVLGAVGGMAVPALIYAAFNWGQPSLRGWAIPAATDIAFSLGVLSLLGSRVPASLRAFLAALAIADDLGAIVIIAIFYTEKLSLLALALGLAGVAVMIFFNRLGVARLAPYLLTAIFVWACVLESGVHATLAGVAAGLTIPLRTAHGGRSPSQHLEHILHPWVAYAILPLFALANAGLSLSGLGLRDVTEPIFLGIALGLFVGKQSGVFAASWLAIRTGLAELPEHATWRQVYGVSVLTGIGFTMSLFIGSLAFPAGEGETETRLGVLVGSLLAAAAGYAILSRRQPQAAAAEGRV